MARIETEAVLTAGLGILTAGISNYARGNAIISRKFLVSLKVRREHLALACRPSKSSMSHLRRAQSVSLSVKAFNHNPQTMMEVGSYRTTF